MIADLSRVALAERFVLRWITLVPYLVPEALRRGVRCASDVPDECARIEADGSLTVFVAMPDGSELGAKAAPDEWAWLNTALH